MEDIGLLGEEFIVWALTGLGYTDVRRSTYKYDDKKDGTAITPDGKFITWEGKTENFFQTKPGYTFSPTQTQYDKMQNAGMIFIVDTAWHPWGPSEYRDYIQLLTHRKPPGQRNFRMYNRHNFKRWHISIDDLVEIYRTDDPRIVKRFLDRYNANREQHGKASYGY